MLKTIFHLADWRLRAGQTRLSSFVCPAGLEGLSECDSAREAGNAPTLE